MHRCSPLLKSGFALLFVLLGGCASVVSRSLPYDAWSLDFFNPDYMEVWIETADVLDINDHVFRGAGRGIPSTGYPRGLSKGIPAVFKGDAKGWFEDPTGKGRYVTGADLPRLVYVRWQSMAEPQTYGAYIEIPESARDTMLKAENAYCGAVGKWKTGIERLIKIFKASNSFLLLPFFDAHHHIAAVLYIVVKEQGFHYFMK